MSWIQEEKRERAREREEENVWSVSGELPRSIYKFMVKRGQTSDLLFILSTTYQVALNTCTCT